MDVYASGMTESDIIRALWHWKRQMESRVPTGVGVSTAFGGMETRATQIGFPVELTSAWSATTGYSWKQLTLQALTIDDPDDADGQRTGDSAVTIDNNTSLPAGTLGWLEIDPQAGGWIFTAVAATLDDPTTTPGTGSVPVFTVTTTLAPTPLFVHQFTVNGDPAASVILYTVENPTTTTPAIRQYSVTDSGGSVQQLTTEYYPEGTGQAVGVLPSNTPVYTTITIPTKVTHQYTLPNSGSPRVLQYTVDNPSAGNIRQLTTGTNTTYGESSVTAIDASGRITSVTNATQVYNTSNAATVTFSASGSDTVGALSGVWTAPTQSASDNSTRIATTAYVDAAASGGGASWELLATWTHADLTDADTSQDLTVNVAAKRSVLGLVARTKTVGSGGGVLSLSMTILINGSGYGSDGDGLVANAITNYYPTGGDPLQLYSWTAATPYGIRFSSDVNVADLTGGEWELYGLTADLP